MDEDKLAQARARIKSVEDRHNAKSVDQQAREFLRCYWGDEGMLDAIRDQMKDSISFNPRSVIRGLVAIETLLGTTPHEGTLLDIVLWDANHPMDDPSEQSARKWLQEMAEFTRDVLGEYQPPRLDSQKTD